MQYNRWLYAGKSPEYPAVLSTLIAAPRMANTQTGMKKTNLEHGM